MADRVWAKSFQFFDANGDPLASGTINIYDATTTNARTVYKDAAAGSSWTQPITLGSDGRLTDPVYVPTGAWKYILKNSAGSTITSEDNIPGAVAAATATYARIQRPVLAKASNYTVTTSDLGSLIAADATGGNFTLTLPSAVDAGDGKDISVQAVGTGGRVTIATTGGQLVNGASSVRLFRQYAFVTITSDGSAWYATGSDLPITSLAKTANYTVTLADAGRLIKCDATSAAFTVSLPVAATAGDGFEVVVKKTDSSANAITIDGDSSETVDGSANITLSAQYLWARVRCDGTAWHVVARGQIASQVPYTDAFGSQTTAQGGIDDREPLGKVRAINTQTDNYTFALTDAGKTVEMNSASTKAFTIPTNTNVAFVTGAYINVSRYGSGALTVVGDTGVTLNGVSGGTITISPQYGGATLYKRGTNEWVAPNFTAV